MGFNDEIIRSLGMTLIHSLWEGLVIWVLILFAMAVAGKTNARIRYAFHVSGLMLLLAAFFTTWYILYHRGLQSLQIYTFANRLHTDSPGVINSSFWKFSTGELIMSVHRFLEPFYPSLALGWMAGFIFMIVRMTGGLYYSHMVIRKEVNFPDPSLAALFKKAVSRLGIRTGVTLRMTYRMVSPMVIGIIKPCVIVPVSILSGLNSEQVEAILVHELAHIRRYDHIILIIQAVTTRILFFHPVAWYFSAGLNRERENCCDDIVMKTFSNPINYIKALTMIQELNVTGPVPASALIGRSKSLLGRIKRLLSPETKHAPTFRFTAVLLFLITLGIAVIAFANSGNNGRETIFAGIFSAVAEKPQAVRDTVKNKADVGKAEQNVTQNREEDRKKKELEEANRRLQKAQKDLQKAQRELEKARQEIHAAREKLKIEDLADFNDDLQHEIQNAQRVIKEQQLNHFWLEHNDDLKKQMQIMNDEMGKAKDALKDKMHPFKQEEMDRLRQEWHKSGEEIRKAMEEFFRSRKDSNLFYHRPDHFNFHPFPPFPPEVPLSVPVPEINEIEIPVLPEMDKAIPEPEHPMDLMRQDNEEHENEESLDSKLREVEESDD